MKPAVTIGRKFPYKNSHAKVIVDTLECEGKKWEYVYLKKQPKSDGLGVIPIDETGVFLVNQYRHPMKKKMWQIILGGVENGENLICAVRTELEEEAGIKAGKIRKLGVIIAEPGLVAQKTHLFLAKDLTFGLNHPEVSEGEILCQHFIFKEFRNMILTGKILCSFTISAFYLLNEQRL